MHLLGYLKKTKGHHVTFRAGNPAEITAYVDAGYATYPDAKSLGGLFITIAGGCVCAVSKRQSIVTNCGHQRRQ
jgi:hypothetical protein